MLRLFTDFNARTKAGECWNLVHHGVDIGDTQLVKNPGDRVILYQDEDDFEVEATIEFRFVDELKQSRWVAKPDWATNKKLHPLGHRAAE
jgi:hypothetical protein